MFTVWTLGMWKEGKSQRPLLVFWLKQLSEGEYLYELVLEENWGSELGGSEGEEIMK